MLLKTIYLLCKTVIELPETLFRSYRFSDKDVEVMDKKGYYFDANTGRFRKENGKRGWYFDPNKPYKARYRKEVSKET